ncbi:MAG: hypothetical protein KBB77_03495 [Candidatus Moranbacteria bacterium]|jgi:nitrate reductase NapE component|nr:hypothetical protein [Candidatus Moranbacteria bacterium]
MEEVKMETLESQAGCETCAKHAKHAQENEEMSFAFLLALMPVLTISFFGQVGLL